LSHNLVEKIDSPFQVDPNTNEFVIDPATGENMPYEPEDPGLDEAK